MKTNKVLKVMSIIILIIILIAISFVGIYVKENGKLTNIVKGFTKDAELGVEREYVFSLSDATTTEYYDSEGKLVLEEDVDKDAEEGTYTTKTVNVNLDEAKTAENYKKAKELMEKRIKDLSLEQYRITVDENNGNVVLKTLEDSQTSDIIYAVCGQGEFLLKDAETQEVLLDNNDIKNAKVGYYPAETGTTVYLTINLNKEGKEKLKNISSTYVKTTETKDVTAEDGTVSQEKTEVTKNVKLYIDGDMIINTYFGEVMENGQLQLTMGKETADTDELRSLLLSATAEATKLSNGPMPLIYKVTSSSNILSIYDKNFVSNLEIVAIILLTILLIFFVIRFKERAIMSSILFVGFTALYLLVLRYANVTISAASICGFTFIELFMIYFINKLLAKLKNYDINENTPKSIINSTLLRAIIILLPVLIISLIFAMFTYLPVSSLGTILFWGIVLFVVYSYLCVKTLLLNFEYLFEEKKD